MNDFSLGIDAVGKGKIDFAFRILASIIWYQIIGFMAAILLPSTPIAKAIGVIVAFTAASFALKMLFHANISFEKPRKLYIYLALFISVSLNIILWHFPLDEKQIHNFYTHDSLTTLIYIVLVCIVSPTIEEVYFRGLLFPTRGSIRVRPTNYK